MFSFDWRTLFIPSGSLLELFVRGTLIYFFILAAMRCFAGRADRSGPPI